MSETLIRGYAVDLALLASVPGSKDERLLAKIVGEQQDLLAQIGLRFSDGLAPQDALAMLINGHPQDDHAFELQCILEPVLEVLGHLLPDNTPARSLWFNQDFWLEDFAPIFEELGLAALAKRWQDGSLPFRLTNVEVNWPTFTTLSPDDLDVLAAELAAHDSRRLSKLSKALFREKSEDLPAKVLVRTMRENVAEIGRWISLAREASATDGLVLLFDGDS